MYQALGIVAGAGLNAYGSSQQHQAMAGAQRRYGQEMDGYYGQEQADARDFQRKYQEIGDRRLNRIGGALDAYMAEPYGQTAGDTGTVDRALGQVGGGANAGNPGAGMGGAAQTWGAGVANRRDAATGRQRMVAGDANQLSRQSQGQTRALQDQGIADSGFARDQDRVRQMEQIRKALMARQLQQINQRSQGAFDQASRVGNDWKSVGSMLGAGGGLMDAYGGGGAKSGYSSELGYDPDQENRGSYVTGWQ